MKLAFNTHSDDLIGLDVLDDQNNPIPGYRKDMLGRDLDEFSVLRDTNDRGGVAVQVLGQGEFYVIGEFTDTGRWELRIVFGPMIDRDAETPSWHGPAISARHQPDTYKATLEIVLPFAPADVTIVRLEPEDLKRIEP